jgi:hypothetical protein
VHRAIGQQAQDRLADLTALAAATTTWSAMAESVRTATHVATETTARTKATGTGPPTPARPQMLDQLRMLMQRSMQFSM